MKKTFEYNVIRSIRRLEEDYLVFLDVETVDGVVIKKREGVALKKDLENTKGSQLIKSESFFKVCHKDALEGLNKRTWSQSSEYIY